MVRGSSVVRATSISSSRDGLIAGCDRQGAHGACVAWTVPVGVGDAGGIRAEAEWLARG